ncbi:MAG: UDP-N-acetylmuramoyl-L-alanyl-D-glutamate--2,6-diaminopimelate ligase [Ruminococcus sp.]|nr:UDP-N-acetylmuramoyl-L-alanyl-D-glutamate--2,6-diaminopimelate ligase [Ruminococcus sp.]
MKEIKKQLSALLEDAGSSAEYSFGGADREITGVTDDTRSVKKGSIFVCVKGGSFDGHTAAEDMLKKGAAAVVCERSLGLGGDEIVVKNSRKFFGLLTAAWYDHPERELILIGITGTNGKTTTASLIHGILSFAGNKTGLIGTAGTFAGEEAVERDETTPTTPKAGELYGVFRLMLEKGCKYCVMEVSSFALDQNRIGPAVFDCAVFTNLTGDHLDYHKTMENYYLAKKLLFTDHCRTAFINIDDGSGRRLAGEINCEKFTLSLKGNGDINADGVKHTDMGTDFVLRGKTGDITVSVNMIGGYNIANAQAAVSVCVHLGVGKDKIVQALKEFKGVRGRCELIPTGRDFRIICDYAHSADALENMLPCIKETVPEGGRLICLFGCGGDRDRTKRPLMAKAAAKYADLLIITSDNPRNEDPDSIIDEITAGLSDFPDVPYERITDRREAIFRSVSIARRGDILVLAGKGHEDYQILPGGVHIHFDEREICREALDRLDREFMTIDEIAEICGGKCINIPDGSVRIKAAGISSDTRTMTSGSAFIAFKGEKFDGHDFVRKAYELGAAVCITERAAENIPCVVVKDTYKAILDIAAEYRSRFDIKLAGITGSVGKTTVKEMTALALGSEYNTLKTQGNLNNHVGMPFTLLKLTNGHKAAAIEMGMSHFGEIERLSKTAAPDIAVITNIGWSHAENLGSQQGILQAKLEILKGAKEKAPLIINGDDPLLLPLKDTLDGRRVITCGVKNKGCDYTAEDITEAAESISFSVKGNRITLPCTGVHNVTDALLAYAAAAEAGCSGEKAAATLGNFRLDGLRQHIEHCGGKTFVVDCYNAAPDSMKAAIDVLCGIIPEKSGRRAAVLGDMLELGERSDELHREVGRYAAEKGVDLLVCFGEKAAYIAAGADESGTWCYTSKDKDEIAAFLKAQLKPGDAVLFKASRGVHMEDILNACRYCGDLP